MEYTRFSQSFPTEIDYSKLIEVAKKADYSNYLDMVHDAIVSASNFKDALLFLKGGQYKYKSVIPSDTTQFFVTDQVCKTCNEVYPAGFFQNITHNGNIYKRNTCRNCINAYHREVYAKNGVIYRQNRKKRLNGLVCKTCNKVLSDVEIASLKDPTRKLRRNCTECRHKKKNECAWVYRRRQSEKIKSSQQQYYAKNRERNKLYNITNFEKIRDQKKQWRQFNKLHIKKYKEQYRALNKQKINEYQRQYRAKKKANQSIHILDDTKGRNQVA